ncbi:MAG: uroporphyrinogen decarboxylase [Cyclonatronaceae bacterium]
MMTPSSPNSNFPPLKNDLLLQALHGKDVPRPPVWMMRQAGRHLPEYMKLREKYSFFERVETPELACEITMQPIRRYKPDAAIIFSDILVVLQALGLEVTLVPGQGPRLPDPVQTPEAALALQTPDVADRLHYVMEALRLTRHELNGEAALIGFAGAPWTLFCYMVEGRGSKDFSRAKAFYWQHPEAARHALRIITETTIAYLKGQIAAGAQAVQVFDSWSGLLSPEDFTEIAYPYLKQISDAITEVPVILYAKGSWYALEGLTQRSGAAALGVDWCITPEKARELTGGRITLQGNFDPARLLSTPEEITRLTRRMIDRFGARRYIANLGHGILPFVPIENARAFIEAVKNWTPEEG